MLIYFVDDLNMPQLDKYNTQTAIALLRQLIDYNHWYDLSTMKAKEIKNTLQVCCMNPTAGSFYVNPRLQRNFWTCSVPEPKRDSLSIIYSTILDGHFLNFKQGIKDQKNNIIKGALQLHQAMQKRFKKTAVNFHYEFNVRHLACLF